MDGKKYCAYNKTQGSFLSLRISVVDNLNTSSAEPGESQAGNSQTSLWLQPDGEIPAGFGPSGFDYVFLDEDHRVVDVAEARPGAPREMLRVQAASVLALPPNTIASTDTSYGDELVIWASKAEVQQPGLKSKPNAGARLKPILAPAFPGKSAEPLPVSLNAVRLQDSTPLVEEREVAELSLDEKQSLLTRFKRWVASSLPQFSSDAPISIVSAAHANASDATPATWVPAASISATSIPEPTAAPFSAGWFDSEPIAPVREVPASVARTPVDPAPIPNLHVVPAPVSAPITSYSDTFARDHFAAKVRPERTAPPKQPPQDFVERRREFVEFTENPGADESGPEEAPSLIVRFLRWLAAPPRASRRHKMPGLVAYYWTGGNPQPHPVINISTSGVYLRTQDRWLPDTVLVMSLQRTSGLVNDPDNGITVLSKVTRHDEEGVGLQFVTSDSIELRQGHILPGMGTDKAALKEFLEHFERLERGA
jgi:hypothetical protein